MSLLSPVARFLALFTGFCVARITARARRAGPPPTPASSPRRGPPPPLESNRCLTQGNSCSSLLLVRWDAMRIQGGGPGPPALFERGAVARTFDTPGFRGMTFYEIQARSIINRVPGASRMPFHWTINPYRGCSHACVYCFARNTHTYLDLDAGHDFDSKIVVKVNAPELLRRRAGRAALAGRAHRDGHQRRLLPARRGPLPADAGHHRGAARRRQPVLDPDQGHADPARPRPAGARPPRSPTSGWPSPSASPTRSCGGRSSRARRARGGAWRCAPRSPTAGSAAAC